MNGNEQMMNRHKMKRKRLSRRTFVLSVFAIGLTAVSFQLSVSQNKTEQILQSLGGHAEDMVDFFQSDDYAKADSTYSVMQNEAAALYKLLDKTEAHERVLVSINASLSTIHESIQTKHAMNGALVSNQLTAIVMQLERFPNTTARAVARLDYLAREIILLNKESDWKNAKLLKIRRGDINTTWQGVRRIVLKNVKNANLVARVDEVVGRILKELANSTQIHEGTTLLDLVDELEKVTGQ